MSDLGECPHGCAEFVDPDYNDPLGTLGPYCPKCGHIKNEDCSSGCSYDEV